MKIKPHTVQWRLKNWGEWVQRPREEFARSTSVFGKIASEQFNAGARGDGIVFDVIDGISCRPDGGMAEAVVKRGPVRSSPDPEQLHGL